MKYKKCPWLVFSLFLILVFPGCSVRKDIKKDPFFEKWKLMAKNSKGHSPAATKRKIEIPERIKQMKALEKEAKAGPVNPLPTRKVSLKMYNVEIATLLRALARAADQNLLLKTDVAGKISVNIQDVPWDQVFLGILHTHGLAYAWEGNIIRIMTVEDMEHNLKLNAIQEKQKALELGIKCVEPLLTRVVTINYADATKLKENLKEFLTKNKEEKSRGSIMVDEHTNSLIIQAIMADIARMISLIEDLDRPTPQILIEAHIVEATREAAYNLGIQWGGLYHTGDYWITPGANTGEVLGNSLSTGIDPGSGIAANFPADIGDTGLTLGFVFENIGKSILNVQLSALQEDGQINILSSPSITTLDNQMAFTENGEKVPYVSTDNEGNTDVKFEEAVLRLEITPHVIDERNLKMKIAIKKDEVDTTRAVEGNPFIIKKQTETTLIVEDNETIVISGLTKQTNSNSESGMPGLKDVPVLGYLFKGKNKSDKMEEVLIFITPHILKKQMHYQMNSPEKKIEKTRPSE
jgi:type IV pilus assembly protein PilQ